LGPARRRRRAADHRFEHRCCERDRCGLGDRCPAAGRCTHRQCRSAVFEQDQVVALAARYRIPTSYFNRDFTAAGGLTTNVDDRAELLRQAYIYVGRILKGENPVALRVIQPTKFDLVSNLKTAKELGLTVPPALLNRADEIIE
jgi:ABC-type uncharacterized transport system substrate-binding protein